MNAGGVPNTCKSNEVNEMKFSDGFFIYRVADWVSNAWVTCLIQGITVRNDC